MAVFGKKGKSEGKEAEKQVRTKIEDATENEAVMRVTRVSEAAEGGAPDAAGQLMAAAGAACEGAKASLHIGIDVGSTTVKLAILDDSNKVLWSVYQRHHADVRATIIDVLRQAAEAYPSEPMTIAITGSGGLLLSQWLGIRFVQEVIASKTAVETFDPRHRRRHRAWRRGREDHLLRQRHRAAHERHLRWRHGRLHRPDGLAPEHRRRRPQRAGEEPHHHISHSEPLRRVR